MALRILRIAAATAILALALVAQSAGAALAAPTSLADPARVVPPHKLPPPEPSEPPEPVEPAAEPTPTPEPTASTPPLDTSIDVPPVLEEPDPTPTASPPPDPTPAGPAPSEPPPVDPAPQPSPADGTDVTGSVPPAPPGPADGPPPDTAGSAGGDVACCPGPPPVAPGPDPIAEPTGPDDRPIGPSPGSGSDHLRDSASSRPNGGGSAPVLTIQAAVREATASPDAPSRPYLRRGDPGHAPRPSSAASPLDDAVVASAGIAAGLAVVHRGPPGVAIAMEFGRVGGGWAGAIVFNLWLRRQLSARRMSQRQLAALSGVDHTTISRLLREDRHPSLSTATKIVHALRGVPSDAAEPATADYFDRLPEETIFPARRVELALRADDQLDDDQIRRLMTLYLNARRRSAAARAGPETVPEQRVVPGSRR